MKVKDHFLSQEYFELIPHSEYAGIKITNPAPKDLPRYYESENYISHDSASNTAFQKLYRIIQRSNTSYKLRLIHKHNPFTQKLLDYGCGTGDFLSEAQNKYKTFGHEPNSKALAASKEKNIKTKFIASDLNDVQENTLDCITLWHVLEHLDDPKKYLATFHSKLNRNGILALALPNFNSLDAKLFKSNWAAYDVPRHLYHYTPQGIAELAKSQGYQIIGNYPLLFDSIYISWISANYSKSLFIKLLSPIIGSLSNISGFVTGNFSSHIYIFKKISPKTP